MSSTPDQWFLFAFDHRDSFRRMVESTDHATIVAAKSLLFDGFSAAFAALPDVVQANGAAILIDEEYGSSFVSAARTMGAKVVMPVEASGRDELAFEYGDNFAEHIGRFDPHAIKVLLRWDPHGDSMVNGRQGELLASLSTWMRANGRQLIVEFLTPMCEPSSARAELMALAVEQILAAGAEADVWKVEGLDDAASCQTVAAAITTGGRDDVRAVVLGRGTTMERAAGWLGAAREVPAFCGFAIGKTLWQSAMEGHLRGEIDREAAVTEIARRYISLINTWRGV
jgi:myo-inositol catabolism protein IolC